MILSQSCRIAVKALTAIAVHAKRGTNVQVSELAAEIHENAHTLAKALQTLSRHGLVSSVKGPAGGFYLTTKQLETPVIEVIQALDGKGIFEDCVLGLSACSAKKPCPLHHRFSGVRQALFNAFHGVKIVELLQLSEAGKTFLYIKEGVAYGH